MKKFLGLPVSLYIISLVSGIIGTFIGIGSIVLALNVDTTIPSLRAYLAKLILTTDGTPSGSAKIVLDGSNGGALFGGDVRVDGELDIDPGHLKDGTILSEDIRDGTIKSQDIKDGEIRDVDLSENSVGAREIKENNIYTFKGINVGQEDTYGNWVSRSRFSFGLPVTDSCDGDVHSAYVCDVNIQKSCVDVKDLVGSFNRSRKERNVTCKRDNTIVKFGGKVEINRGALIDGSITSADIANGTVQGIDIRDGTITSADIANGTIDWVDLNSTLQSRINQGGQVVSTCNASNLGLRNSNGRTCTRRPYRVTNHVKCIQAHRDGVGWVAQSNTCRRKDEKCENGYIRSREHYNQCDPTGGRVTSRGRGSYLGWSRDYKFVR